MLGGFRAHHDQRCGRFRRCLRDNVAATITAHHLLYNRNAIFAGGIRPHYYCLPVLKRKSIGRRCCVQPAPASSKFFLGTDSAPHARASKEAACGCAGCYTAHAALELYAEAFESMAALDRLEALPVSTVPISTACRETPAGHAAQQEEWLVPAAFPYADGDTLVPLRAGEWLRWRLLD
jgi:dihydroorotase